MNSKEQTINNYRNGLWLGLIKESNLLLLQLTTRKDNNKPITRQIRIKKGTKICKLRWETNIKTLVISTIQIDNTIKDNSCSRSNRLNKIQLNKFNSNNRSTNKTFLKVTIRKPKLLNSKTMFLQLYSNITKLRFKHKESNLTKVCPLQHHPNYHLSLLLSNSQEM